MLFRSQRQRDAADSQAKQLIAKGNSASITSSPESLEQDVGPELARSVEAQIRQRDAQDKSRAVAPLRPAPDAIVIDNAAHRPEQTVDAVLALWALRQLR